MSAEAAEIARLRGIITKLVEAGAQASNCCYNLSQCPFHMLSERECASMREAAALWDTATKHARTPGPTKDPS